MKRLFILFAFFSLISTSASSQGIHSENDWMFVAMNGTSCDSANTKSFLVQDGTGSRQAFNSYGTTKRNGGWYIQSNWVKDFWSSYPQIPDTIAIDVKFIGGVNVLEARLSFGMQDSSGTTWGSDIIIPLNNQWNTLKFDMNNWFKKFRTNFGKFQMSFLLISSDSIYVGASFFVDNLRGIDDTLANVTYDYFGDPPAAVSETGEIPSGFTLGQNYPNPFNPSTTIKFSILQRGLVKLSVFNLLGQEVTTLVNEKMETGSYETVFNASNLPSGTYFYKLLVGASIEVKRMLLLK